MGRKKTVKDEREGKKKSMAGREFNWAMLYMNVYSSAPVSRRMRVLMHNLFWIERCGGFLHSRQDEYSQSRYPES
jgi:hypothetical protein